MEGREFIKKCLLKCFVFSQQINLCEINQPDIVLTFLAIEG